MNWGKIFVTHITSIKIELLWVNKRQITQEIEKKCARWEKALQRKHEWTIMSKKKSLTSLWGKCTYSITSCFSYPPDCLNT